MSHIIRLLAIALLAGFLALPGLARAEEKVPTAQEIRESEGEPPLIPHRIADTDTARECLKCHGTGKKGAPVTSHPERKACTQCHVQGEVKGAKPAGKKK
jgi:nitrate reductase cytochrome c-type subunit